MEEKNIQTKKQLAVLGVVLILILLSAIVPAEWLGITPKKYSYKKLDLNTLTSPQEIAEDTNNDGTVGWNEIVISTFKDSTSTLLELNKKPIDKKIIAELNDPNNLTSSFSKNVFLATAYLRDRGITDEATKREAVDYLVQQEAKKIVVTTYKPTDIKLAKNETKDSIKAYGNAIAPIIQDLISSKIITKDILSVSSFTTTQNENDLKPLIENKKRLDGLLQKLLAIEVPPSAMTYHILALNRVALYRDTVDNLSKSASDPVRGTLSVDTYQDAMLLVVRLPNQFYDYFTVQNIVFTAKEAGYMFTTSFNYN